MALDPLHCSLWQLGSEPLQHLWVNDPISIMLFCPQLLLAGVVELLGKCEQLVNPLHGQHVELMLVLFWSVADQLRDGSFQVPILKHVVSAQLLCCKVGLLRQE